MFLSKLLEILGAGEALLVALIARLAPWLPPLPTAWLVYDRAVRYLHWPPWTAISAGLAVECLGMLCALTAVELYSYNRVRLKTEPRAPLYIPIALAILYLLIAELLTLGLDLAPRLAAGEGLTVTGLAAACFPPLSLLGMILLAVRVDQRARLAENAAAKEKRRQDRRENAGKRQSPLPAAESTAIELESLRELDRERADRLREIFPAGESFTRAEVETALDLRSTAATTLLSRLRARGIIEASGSGRGRRYSVGPNDK